MSDPSYTVSEFCAAERISRAQLYLLWAEGKGPKHYIIGKSSHRRITHAARLEWQAERMADAENGGAR
jgi:hypothetical protein